MLKKLIIFTLITATFSYSEGRIKSAVHRWDKIWDRIYDNFDFVPEIYLDIDLSTFMNFKNSEFKERYLLENNTNLDITIFSFRDRFYSLWYVDFQTFFGRKGKDNVIFDPREINFGLVKLYEFRFKPLLFHFGNNHHCFHEIDQKDLPTVYWNRAFIGIGSNNFRQAEYHKGLIKEGKWQLKDRLSWYFSMNLYMREFFGLVEERTINGENKYRSEYDLQLRYAFYRRKSWILNIENDLTVGHWKSLPQEPEETGLYFSNKVSLVSNFRKGKAGWQCFLTFNVDKLPETTGTDRFSKDKLVQLGVKFFR
jgi:hypothetical protein